VQCYLVHVSAMVCDLLYMCTLFCLRKTKQRHVLKRNPLKNLRIMMRLNPYAGVQKKTAKLVEEERKKQKQVRSDQKRGVSI